MLYELLSLKPTVLFIACKLDLHTLGRRHRTGLCSVFIFVTTPSNHF
jgi:hypothetical protein